MDISKIYIATSSAGEGKALDCATSSRGKFGGAGGENQGTKSPVAYRPAKIMSGSRGEAPYKRFYYDFEKILKNYLKNQNPLNRIMRFAPCIDACLQNSVPWQNKIKKSVKGRGMIGKNQVAEFVQNDKFNVFQGQAH